MRFLHVSLLTLATGIFLTGCGGEAKRGDHAAETERAAPQSSEEIRRTSGADAAAPPRREMPDSATPSREEMVESGETSTEMRFPDEALADVASIPERTPPEAKPEAPRGPEPDDALRAPDAEPEPADPKQAKRRKPQIQAGTLTAGSLNDHKNLDDYRNYLSEVQQSRAGRSLPPFRLGERVLIEVKDSQGNGVSDVQVTVTQIGRAVGENEGVLLDTYTRADGRTFFSSGHDAASLADAGNAKLELTVRPPEGEAIVKQVSVAQSPWVVELPDVTRELPQQLDLALVVDTTGSMSDELNYLKVELDDIVATVHRMFPKVKQRYALICYRDEGDAYVVRNVIDFTGSLPDFREKLAAQSTAGGGDAPEAMHLALENADKLSWRRENTARVMFLVADAAPHRQHYDRSMQAVNSFRRRGVAIYPLAGSGPMKEYEYLMRQAAFLTRGQYLFLTDHSGVGNPHAKPHAPKYEVEPLNQLIIRMIASELSGKEVLAKEILATEESDGSESPPIPQEQNQSSHDDSDHQPPRVHGHAESAHASVDSSVESMSDFAFLVDSTAFRLTAAVLIIAVILLLDQRMRT